MVPQPKATTSTRATPTQGALSHRQEPTPGSAATVAAVVRCHQPNTASGERGRAESVAPGHRPAEPDPVRTGVGSRPARFDAVPGIPEAAFSSPGERSHRDHPPERTSPPPSLRASPPQCRAPRLARAVPPRPRVARRRVARRRRTRPRRARPSPRVASAPAGPRDRSASRSTGRPNTNHTRVLRRGREGLVRGGRRGARGPPVRRHGARGDPRGRTRPSAGSASRTR